MAVSGHASLRPFLTPSCAWSLLATIPCSFIRVWILEPTVAQNDSCLRQNPAHLLFSWIQVATRSLLTNHWHHEKLQSIPQPPPPFILSSNSQSRTSSGMDSDTEVPLSFTEENLEDSDTWVRFHHKHSIVLGVSYTKLATLGANVFSRPWSHNLQKCPGFSIQRLLLVKCNVMCHKFQPQIVHRKRNIFIHNSYT